MLTLTFLSKSLVLVHLRSHVGQRQVQLRFER